MARSVELKLEQYSEEMEYGTISRWLKREGDEIKVGDPMAVVVEED